METAAVTEAAAVVIMVAAGMTTCVRGGFPSVIHASIPAGQKMPEMTEAAGARPATVIIT